MEVAGVERNLVTYSVAINACTRNGQWELGLQVRNIPWAHPPIPWHLLDSPAP